MTAHKPGYCTVGLPVAMPFCNDRSEWSADTWFAELDAFSAKQLHDTVMAALDREDYDQAEAGFKFQWCIEVYDEWWRGVRL